MNKTVELEEYIERHSSSEPEYLQIITRTTHQHAVNPHMLSGHVQGRLLALISKMISPRRILEIGTYTGYSALCLAEGLAADGRLLTIERNDELEDRIRENLALTELGRRIELRTGDACEMIRSLPADERFDLVFIDGDKREYVEYWNAVKDRLTERGWIIADNTLWDGHVVDANYDKDAQTRGLRAFNDKVAVNEEWEKVIIPLRDGLSVMCRRDQTR
ncbi:MAG: O-methyltransferase [Paludibacteraceae bacterium]|nr:O-methyltransferase [Paludibacteraceae bacterium]